MQLTGSIKEPQHDMGTYLLALNYFSRQKQNIWIELDI